MAGSKPELLTEEEAAEYLRVTPKTLARIRLSGRIGHLRLAQRSYRYTVDHLEEYLAACEFGPRPRHRRKASSASWAAVARSRRAVRESKQDSPTKDAASSDKIGNGILTRPKDF